MTHMTPAAKYTGFSGSTTGQPSVGEIGQVECNDLAKVVVMAGIKCKP